MRAIWIALCAGCIAHAAEPVVARPAPARAAGCFGGEWSGRSEQDHRSASFTLSLAQDGAQVRGTFHWRELGGEGTEAVTGTADCAARTATLQGGAVTGNAEPARYAITLGADARTTDGTESRFDGTWTCGDSAGTLAGYRRNGP